MPLEIESMHEFDARHSVGGPKLFDPETHCQLFPTGALRTGHGEQREPPVGPELIRGKYRYCALRVSIAEQEWEGLRQDWTSAFNDRVKYGNCRPGPPPDWKEQLTVLGKEVQKLRNERDALAREIAAFPEERARRAYFEQRSAEQHTAVQQLTEITGMRL